MAIVGIIRSSSKGFSTTSKTSLKPYASIAWTVRSQTLGARTLATGSMTSFASATGSQPAVLAISELHGTTHSWGGRRTETSFTKIRERGEEDFQDAKSRLLANFPCAKFGTDKS